MSLSPTEWLHLLPFSEVGSVVGFLLALVLLAQLIKSRRPPSSTIAWLLIIVLAPYVGVPLYLMFGGRKMRQLAGTKARIYGPGAMIVGDEFIAESERILRSYGVPPATAGNAVNFVGDGVEAYHQIVGLIDRAQHSIHMTTFILGQDEVGREIVARLARRAAEGVEVRVLLDAVGCWWVRRSFYRPLIEAGARVAFFMPVLHVPFRGRTNLRNHRKILVVDGRYAMAGGMNVAEEYLGPNPDPRRWRDVALVVAGPSARDLDDVFCSDWRFATRETPPACEGPDPAVEESREPAPESAPPERGPVQVVASGPDVVGDPLYESLIALLFGARRRIWVVTPYFVPDEMLVRALELAARRGVDVRIVVPNRSNHRSADLARVGYLRQIFDAGGKVLRYRPGMIHAKTIVIDDLVMIGSANMDMRSLFLNYEVALFLYEDAVVGEAAAWVEALFPDCRPGMPRQTWPRELAENVVRLLSPLL